MAPADGFLSDEKLILEVEGVEECLRDRSLTQKTARSRPVAHRNQASQHYQHC